MGTVSFPGLGLEFHLNRVAFHIGSWPVYWYGIIIAAGFLLAVLYCCHAAKRFGIKQDDIIDMLFFAVPLSIVGARLYYILFYLDLYRREDGSLDFGAMVRIWDGPCHLRRRHHGGCRPAGVLQGAADPISGLCRPGGVRYAHRPDDRPVGQLCQY